tara:strand:- start:53763 stop:54926 length:1164 start_codon:yes stop_codon:yes gene_type:complete
MSIITEDIRTIFNALAPDEARLVGGAVRDYVLNGDIADDIDIATTAHPQTVIKCLKAAGMSVIPTGLKHGTVTAVYNHKRYEITTLRTDIETHGRHATVQFTDQFKEDAKRRDFTFNALYMNADGKITDYFNGQDDLKACKVRFIGAAEKRIHEDYLRIFRYFRFHDKFKQKPIFDKETLALIQKNALHIQKLSAERITSEILKITASKHAPYIWQAMVESTVTLAISLPDISLDRLYKFQELYPKDKNPFIKLVCLLKDAPQFVNNKHFCFTNKQKKYMRQLLSAVAIASVGENIKQQAYTLGKDIYIDALKIQRCLNIKNEIRIQKTIESIELFDVPTFPISGDDLINLGYKTGEELGHALQELENWWLLNNFPPKDACLLKIKR